MIKNNIIYFVCSRCVKPCTIKINDKIKGCIIGTVEQLKQDNNL
jgi:hypothetical protein